MDSARDSEFPSDLSPLAWVQDEMRRSLEAVHKTLRRQLRDGDSSRMSGLSIMGNETLQPSQALQGAAAQLHQVAGVLQLVGVPAGTAVLRAAEFTVDSLAQNPQNVDLAAVELVERADFALLSYVARVLAGNKTSTLSLFPSYRDLQSYNGAERIHPADVWQFDWTWRELPSDPTAGPMAASAVRPLFEAALLKQMRESTLEGQLAHAGMLSELCAALAAGLPQPRSRTLWQLAAAMFQAQAQGLLGIDAYVKRLGSRLLSQMRSLDKGDEGLAGNGERLAQDLLFFCAQSRLPEAGSRGAPRLRAVRETFGLHADHVGDYEDESLGRIDPAWVAQAKRRAGVAKDSWSGAAEGDKHRLTGLDEQFAALAESLARLFPSGDVLGETMQRAIVATLRSGKPPSAALAMEIATSILYVEAAIDDAAFDQPEQSERVKRLASRVEAVAHGEPPQPLEAWMEDLYRRVSDRQTLGSVVHELRASLSEVERQADEYFRDPSQRQLLIPVPAQLQAMRGVLSVLGLDQAAQACLRMRDEVDELANTEVDTARGGPRELFERLANNLGALGFLIDMLSVQPQLAKRMFRFDDATSRLSPVMGRRHGAVTVPELVSVVEPALAAAPVPMILPVSSAPVPEPVVLEMPELPELEGEAIELVHSHPVPLDVLPPAPPPAAEVDPEMREIFLEEATEVLADARRALAALHQDGHDKDALTTLRRAFHTLKGSSRMVGLDAYGEGAWACEQLYNARLGEATPVADIPLVAFTADALDYLGQWSDQIAGRRAGHFLPDPLRRGADALRLQAEQETVDESALTERAELSVSLAPLAFDLPPEEEAAQAQPAAEDEPFVLSLPVETVQAAEAPDDQFADTVLPVADAAELPSFELRLDLGEPDLPPPSPAPEPEIDPLDAETQAAPLLELVSSPAVAPEPEDSDDGVKVIGPLRIGIALFNIFLNEADELSRRLGTTLAEWALELSRPVPASSEALAHALAGNAATVGYEDLSALARALEHALSRAQRATRYSEADSQLFLRSAEDIRTLLHQFAAGFLKPMDLALLEELQSYEPEMDSAASHFGGLPAPEVIEAGPTPHADDDENFEPGLPDQIEPELFAIFEEEARDLLGDLHGALREWLANPAAANRSDACMRALHTFKGGARLAGAMRLGEQAHHLESAIESLLRGGTAPRAVDLIVLQDLGDALETNFEALLQAQQGGLPVAEVVEAVAPVPELEPEVVAEPEVEPQPEPLPVAEVLAEPEAEPASPAAMEAPVRQSLAEIDWSRFSETPSEEAVASEAASNVLQALVRVRGSLLERMATQAGEVSIRRARLESELAQMKGGLLDLDDNLDRLRTQLRELEVQAEAQMGRQQEAAQAAAKDFDPLEFDRYTRFQELTRMLAESVNDVATVQRSLQRNVQLGEDELAAQSRLTRELQDDLLRTRLVEFDSLSERMHRVVRQAARDAGRQAQLQISGGHTELDRSVLERMSGAIEHLLRNSISHGIEAPEQRTAAGKEATGTVFVDVSQEGNEVILNFSDDGAGLNLARIRERGLKQGLIAEGEEHDDQALMQLIFAPGFSTAAKVTELSGRGVGMDVVRAEVSTLGGSIEIASVEGQGASFVLRLPLTTALTQIVLLRCGEMTVAVPAALMESVLRMPADQVEAAYASGHLDAAGHQFPFYWLGGLLGQSARGHGHGKTLPVILVRSGQHRLALHVDEVMGNQEVVVKNLGPQLHRVPGLAGISLLASGDVALIYNPGALAGWYGAAAHARMAQQAQESERVEMVEAEEVLAPLVLVVDDSLTVRRVTQRLLLREGFRVQLAKDGMDAMEQLASDELPDVVLSDIEMPRMDGFDLVRNMRADERLANLPVIMITSRIAQKHKDYAQQLGVEHYLGKPYDEEQLLELIGRYTTSHIAI